MVELGSLRSTRHHSRAGSWGQRLVTALGSDRHVHGDFDHDPKGSIHPDDRVWYDQFTSTDWVHDSIADAYRLKALRTRKDLRGRLYAFFDGSQGWILSALVGCVTATIAYFVDIAEPPVFDFKEGHCSDGWYKSERVSIGIISITRYSANIRNEELLSKWGALRCMAVLG
jgi:chloride channel 3/4/5